MKNQKPDLRESKRKVFVSDSERQVRLVTSTERNETHLDENSIRENSRTSVQWMCDLCGRFVASWTEIEGERLGFPCGCLERRVRKILSDQLWQPGSHTSKDINRAVELRKYLRERNGGGFFARIKKIFGRL
ncbi:MAG: hypothetical protein WBD36_03870 [Bacteroidota bacterium]